jgi:hypothetical protein
MTNWHVDLHIVMSFPKKTTFCVAYEKKLVLKYAFTQDNLFLHKPTRNTLFSQNFNAPIECGYVRAKQL